MHISHGPDRVAAARVLPKVIWNRSATKVKLEYVPPTQANTKPHMVLERTTSMVEASQVRAGRIGSISPSLVQTKRPEKLHTAVLKHLLKPFSWRPQMRMGPPSGPSSEYGTFDLKLEHIKKLCSTVKDRLRGESPVLHVPAPVKIFGDIHGQYGDLMQYFRQLGTPCDWMPNGDISSFNYLFLGDWVDRGKFSLETVCLLFALKCQFPVRVFLVRGNHEDPGINRFMGFHDECVARMGQRDGSLAFDAINDAFQWLSPAAVVEHSILCVHGGIGRIKWLRQLDQLTKPCAGVQDLISADDPRGPLLTDVLWSDPTQGPGQQGESTTLDGGDGAVSTRGNTTSGLLRGAAAGGVEPRNDELCDDVVAVDADARDLNGSGGSGGAPAAGSGENDECEEDERGLLVGRGIGVNSRGEGICTFDEGIVRSFLRRNRLRCIIRAHEVTMDGFDLHSDGHLVTLFSATNYCGVCKNNGAVIEATWGDAHSSAGYTHDRSTLVLQAKLISAAVETDARSTWVMGRTAAPPTPPRDRPNSAGSRLSRQNTAAGENPPGSA